MNNSSSKKDRRQLVQTSGFWQWEYDGESARDRQPLFGRGTSAAIVGQWEHETRSPFAKFVFNFFSRLRRNLLKFALICAVFLIGAVAASGPQSAAVNLQLREHLRRTEARLSARQGELELVRLEMSRLNTIMDHSSRYKIPADLATSIYDISLSEGIDPKVAFALVSVESDFLRKAVSHKGAIGLTQVMPATARILDPSIGRSDLFDRETNLRLGFRFLRQMLSYYKGDLNLALTAYNRGPGTVDEIRKAGGDPNNGYARAVLSGGQ
jgi:hypothetical protein